KPLGFSTKSLPERTRHGKPEPWAARGHSARRNGRPPADARFLLRRIRFADLCGLEKSARRRAGILPAETAVHQQMPDCLLRRIRFGDLCGLKKSARRYLLSKIGQGRVVLLRRVNRNESGSNQADPEKARNSAISSTHSQSG